MEKIERELILNVDRKTLWDFVSTPVNLNDITPPDLDFRIVSDLPETIHNGLIIVYEISLPIIGRRKWVTEIKHVREGISFVDEQRSGPYGFWYHLHELADAGEGRSSMRDQVHYQVPFGLFGRSFAGGMVRSRLEDIFDYRSARMKEIFR
ncbi:MAG: SRPBCC family protein [Desulfuromonadales bacterium]|nr:SRPBCC family protein [Desulfuromonadales bacterium]